MFQIQYLIKGSVQLSALNYRSHQGANVFYDALEAARKARSLVTVEDDFGRKVMIDGADLIFICGIDVAADVRAQCSLKMLAVQIEAQMQRQFAAAATPELVIAK